MALANSFDNACKLRESADGSAATGAPPGRNGSVSPPPKVALRRGWLLVQMTAATFGLGNRGGSSGGAGFCGEVVAAGARVNLSPGTRVFGRSKRATPQCGHLAVRASQVCLGPETIDDVALATAGVAGLLACNGLRRVARLQSGQALAIGGAHTAVGAYAIQLGAQLGALVTAYTDESHADLCRQLGAHCVRHPESHPLLGEHEHDLYFDADGLGSLRQVRRLLAADGLYLSVRANGRNRLDQLRTATSFGRRARLVTARWHRRDAQWLADLLAAGTILPSVDEIVSAERAEQQLAGNRRSGQLIAVAAA